MARVKFDDKYVFAKLEKVGNALILPVNLYLIGGAANPDPPLVMKYP